MQEKGLRVFKSLGVGCCIAVDTDVLHYKENRQEERAPNKPKRHGSGCAEKSGAALKCRNKKTNLVQQELFVGLLFLTSCLLWMLPHQSLFLDLLHMHESDSKKSSCKMGMAILKHLSHFPCFSSSSQEANCLNRWTSPDVMLSCSNKKAEN
jgi:hypothetical protein